MSSPQLTEERLRSWLDANQVQRERLCIAVLSLNGGYENVRPRRPKGGPDGGRDIEATYQGREVVWGAVGFRNSADDSTEDKKWVRKKFDADLATAMDGNPDLYGFVFFTNVDLTPAQVDELVSKARERGLRHCEVYHRERLRIALDSPAGLGFRFQYLGIAMSEAEQAAFFERFGSDLELMVKKGFATVDQKLKRLEFFHDSRKEIQGLTFWIDFREPVAPDDLGHFRFLLEIIDLGEGDPHPTLWIGGRDAYLELVSQEESTKLPGVKMLAWSRNPDESIQSTVMGLGMSETIAGVSSFTGVYGKGPFQRLEDLDTKSVNIFVTDSITEYIGALGLIANGYAILGVPASELVMRPQEPLAEWPEELADDEKEIQWVQVLLKGDDPNLPPPAWPTRNWAINFGVYTPEKLEDAE